MEPWICSIRPENFNDEVLMGKKPLLIGCLAQDESFDRQVKVLRHIAQTYGDDLKVSVLANDTMEICKKKLQIIGSPTFLLMKEGRETGRILGVSDQAMLSRFIEQHLPACRLRTQKK